MKDGRITEEVIYMSAMEEDETPSPRPIPRLIPRAASPTISSSCVSCRQRPAHSARQGGFHGRVAEPSAAAYLVRSIIGRAWRVRFKPTGPFSLQRHAPGNGGFVGIGRPNQGKMGNDAAGHQLLDGLMRRAVLTQKNAIVGQDKNRVRLHQRREAQRRPCRHRPHSSNRPVHRYRPVIPVSRP